MEPRKYFDRLQNKIGETKSADKIIEGPWWDIVVRELNQTSLECAKVLKTETGNPILSITLMARLLMICLMRKRHPHDCWPLTDN